MGLHQIELAHKLMGGLHGHVEGRRGWRDGSLADICRESAMLAVDGESTLPTSESPPNGLGCKGQLCEHWIGRGDTFWSLLSKADRHDDFVFNGSPIAISGKHRSSILTVTH
jgi:hypothetical protein